MPTASGFWHWAVADIPAAVNDLRPAPATQGSSIPDPGWQLFYESGGIAIWAPLRCPAAVSTRAASSSTRSMWRR
ncbi:hypothetical protein [Actinacidiphila glaucinigra]|uniref:hypothetical protein n=1 Tax=Actinacidiphila glaucinigra TaxID=235986 RepID=UPI0035D7E29C